MDETGSYICDHCGEEIEVSLDTSAGSEQEYVEDCPVCCSPQVLRVSWDSDGQACIVARSE